MGCEPGTDLSSPLRGREKNVSLRCEVAEGYERSVWIRGEDWEQEWTSLESWHFHLG